MTVSRRLSKGKFRSARQLIRMTCRLGIPEFQRGLVWGEDLVAKLLESLYLGTPCGNIILWAPLPGRESAHLGQPLRPEGTATRFVIDGQQRIRSLWAAFGTDRRSWHIYLPKVPETAADFGGDHRPAMFRRLKFPTTVSGVLSLDELLGEADSHQLAERLAGEATQTRSHTKLAQALERVRWRARGMLEERLFAVSTLREAQSDSGALNDLASMVSLYNRINSSGKPVESEERAFASLAGICGREASDWLRRTFDAVHGPRNGGCAGSLERDDLLQRERERMFGFKLFIRTLVQVCAFHVGRPRPRGGWPMELLASPGFEAVLKVARRRRENFDAATRILSTLRGAVEKLGCDDLRWLPDTGVLVPLTHLLLRFPQLPDRSGGADLIRAVMLSLLLAPRLGDSASEIVNVVERAQQLEPVVEYLRGELDPRCGDLPDLAAQLDEANTLQHRLVLLLYWRLRCAEAKDFSYAAVGDAKPVYQERGAERLLCRDANPERQHLIPYSVLERIYPELRGETRLTAQHPANGIGNLTWISRALNSHETGYGADVMDLEAEPAKNREVHCLEEPGFQATFRSAAEQRLTRSEFEEFTAGRRMLLARGFSHWLEKVWEAVPTQGWKGWASPRADGPTADDRVGMLGYEDHFRERLLALVRATGATAVSPMELQDRASELKLRAKHRPRLPNGGKRRNRVILFDLELRPNRIRILPGNALREWFQTESTVARLRDGAAPTDATLLSGIARIEAEIKEMLRGEPR